MKTSLDTTLLGLKMSNCTFRWNSVIVAYLSISSTIHSQK
uniref:Uncharacterized protein n=1 Tax=Rhizophora mucronata TaxID=61149 RepID=A0A2P2QFP1_RHIMU